MDHGAVTKTEEDQYNTVGQLTKLLDWRWQAWFPALGDKRPTSRSFLLHLGGFACNPKSLRSSHAKTRRDSGLESACHYHAAKLCWSL